MMIWNSANVFSTLLAMGAPAGNGQPTAPWYVNMFPLFLLLFAFYFAILRPQQKRVRDAENRAVRADADRERQHGRDREARAAGEGSDRVADVLQHRRGL